MPGPRPPAQRRTVPGPRTAAQKRPAPDTVSDVTRWAGFCCGVVPVVLVWCGTSLAGAISTALGLGAVTLACGTLLRQSQRGAARLRAEEIAPHRGRHSRTGTGAHRGGRHSGGNTPVD